MNYMPAVRTTPSVEAFKKYWWNRKATVNNLIMWIVLIVIDVLLIAVGVITPGASSDDFLMIFVILGIIYIIRMVNTPKKLYDRVMKISPDQVETVAFGDIGFTVELRGTNVMEHREIPYVRVTSAQYKDGWFYIVVDQIYTNFFCTSDFIEGTPEELLNILSAKVGNRLTVKM